MGLSSRGVAEAWLKRWVGNGHPPGCFLLRGPPPASPLQPARPLQRPHPFVSLLSDAFPDRLAAASDQLGRLCRPSARSARPDWRPGPRQAPAGCPNRGSTTAQCRGGFRPCIKACCRWCIQALQAIPLLAFSPPCPARIHTLRFCRSQAPVRAIGRHVDNAYMAEGRSRSSPSRCFYREPDCL